MVRLDELVMAPDVHTWGLLSGGKDCGRLGCATCFSAQVPLQQALCSAHSCQQVACFYNLKESPTPCVHCSEAMHASTHCTMRVAAQ